MICAVVLAAGRSERMGRQKLLLPLGGKPVITRVVDELLRGSVDLILIVVGRDGGLIREALCDRPVQIIENSDPDSDMLGSIRCGLCVLPVTCEGILVSVGDQPGISGELVEEMIRCFHKGEFRIVAPVLEGSRRHPILFSAQFREELLNHHDGNGLRGLLEAHPEQVFQLAVSDRSEIEDMDTPEDYERQLKLFSASVKR
jgi:molybdenum cofactor cytidylyltransferase